MLIGNFCWSLWNCSWGTFWIIKIVYIVIHYLNTMGRRWQVGRCLVAVCTSRGKAHLVGYGSCVFWGWIYAWRYRVINQWCIMEIIEMNGAFLFPADWALGLYPHPQAMIIVFDCTRGMAGWTPINSSSNQFSQRIQNPSHQLSSTKTFLQPVQYLSQPPPQCLGTPIKSFLYDSARAGGGGYI